MSNDRGYRGNPGRDDIRHMLATAKMAEKQNEAAKLAATDPERQFVMDMEKRLYREYRMFASLTSELQVMFVKQRPEEGKPLWQLASSMVANSKWDPDEKAFIMDYGIVFSSIKGDDEDSLHEVCIALGPKGALISFEWIDLDNGEHINDGPWVMISANLLFIQQLSEWMMETRLRPPVYDIEHAARFTRYVQPEGK